MTDTIKTNSLFAGYLFAIGATAIWSGNFIVVLGPSKAGMVYYTLPLFSGFLGYLFLHESISMIHFYSMMLIFSGIVVTNHESKKVQRIT